MQSRIDAEILVPAWPAAKICGERTMQADDIKSDTRRAQSVPAFAKDIGVGKSTLWEEIRAGRPRAVRLGGRTLLLAEDRERYLRSLPAVTP
jgi:hypothetical protein